MDNEDRGSSSKLEVFASRAFPADRLLVDVVDFLNKSLKRDGYIFGVSMTSDQMTMVIYDTDTTRRTGAESR